MVRIARPGGVVKKGVVVLLTLILCCQVPVSGKFIDQSAQQLTTINYPEEGGSGQITVTVPSEGVVVDANLTLNGKEKSYPSVVDTYDYTDNIGHKAHWGYLLADSPSGKPSGYQKNLASPADIQDISVSDDDRWETLAKPPWLTDLGGNPLPKTPYHLFTFNISGSKNTVTQISMTWEGYGVYPKALGSYCGATMYLWDRTDNSWKEVDAYGKNCVLMEDATLTGSINIQASNNQWGDKVDVLVHGVWESSANNATLYTDYVEIDVRSHTKTYPHDVAVDVINDDDDDIEHTYEGEVRGGHYFSRDEGFVEALQSIINASEDDSGLGNLTVPIRFTSTTGGTLIITINVIEVDTPPKHVLDIPDIDIDEGGESDTDLDLTAYFEDDMDAINLTYHIVWNERPTKVNIWLPGGHNLHLTALDPDWSGTMRFRISASDRFNQTVESNNVTVVVNPVNDPPILEEIGPLTAYENQPFTYQVNVSDADKDDVHTFSDDTDLFDIDQDTGLINFTPVTEDIGDHIINITVTDMNATSDNVLVDLTVLNVNDRPEVTLYLPTDGFVVTVKEIRLVWIGEDPDGDELAYNVFLDSGNGMEQLATGLKKTDHTVSGLKNGTTYEWTVEASDGKLRSERPEPFTFKAEIDEGGGGGGGNQTQPNQPPSSSLISPKRGETVKTLLPTLTWEGYDPDEDELEYEVFVYDRNGGLIFTTKTRNNYVTLEKALTNEQRYFWTVTPFDGEDHGICLSGQWYFTVNRTTSQESFPPIINVTVTPTRELDIEESVKFNASGSEDPDGTIILYIWTFGDGTTLTGPTYQVVDHAYKKGGNYDVSLVIFDDDSRTDIWTYTVNVKVEEPPPPPPPPPDPKVGGLTMDQLLIALLITAVIVALGTIAAFMAYRRVRYETFEIDQIFLIYEDGRLIKHINVPGEEGEFGDGDDEGPDKDIMGSMLTAVQEFVKDSLRTDKKASGFNVLEYGDEKIVIERGEFVFLALIIKGAATKEMRSDMQKVIKTIETENADLKKKWDGNQENFKFVESTMAQLI